MRLEVEKGGIYLVHLQRREPNGQFFGGSIIENHLVQEIVEPDPVAFEPNAVRVIQIEIFLEGQNGIVPFTPGVLPQIIALKEISVAPLR